MRRLFLALAAFAVAAAPAHAQQKSPVRLFVEAEDFAERVTLLVGVPLDQWDACAAALVELSNGAAALRDA